jgi:group I intron endonuclease
MRIYKITNLITGKLYIGQTKHSLKTRFKEHCYPSSKCTHLSNSIKKYGRDNFKIEQILRADSEEQLNSREKFCIRIYDTLHPNGYNLTNGGHNGSHSLITREKLRQLNIGKKASSETITKLSQKSKGENNGMFGRKQNKETRKKISDKLISMKLVSPRKGKFGIYKHTEESKAKISKATKGKPNLKNKGLKRTDEFKKRRSEICTLQNQKQVRNKITGEVLPTAKMLVERLNKPYSTIINMLNGTNPNKLEWEYFTA